MKTPTTARRRASTFRRVGWLAVAAMTTLALVGPAAGPVGAASVAPIYIEGATNISCSDLDGLYGNGQTWSEFKLEGGNLANGTYTVSGGYEITISNFTAPGAYGSFDWSSNFGVDAVLVKTGVAGKNLYVYDPPAESFGDTDLRTPTGSGNGFSHISFCYDGFNEPTPKPTPTPTPTPEPTPTPTPAPESARLVIEKVYDIDPGEAEVLVPGEGWTFDVSGELVTTGASGQVVVDFDDIDGSVSVDITEDSAPEDVVEWVMIAGSCEVTADTNEQLEVAAVGDARGTLDVEAGAMTDVVVNAGETVTCTFTNETGEVEAATATPKVTPPPTDTLPLSGTPGSDSWRIALLAIAGLLATLLLLTPAPSKARRRR